MIRTKTTENVKKYKVLYFHWMLNLTFITAGINLSSGFLSGRQTPINLMSVILYKLGRHLAQAMKLL